MSQSLEFHDIERILTLLNESTDPSSNLTMADRRRLLIAGVAKLVDADVYIWSCTCLNHETPGDYMTTCVVDGGWLSEVEQGAVYEVLIDPDFNKRGLRRLYDMMVSRQRVTLGHDEVFEPEDFDHFMSIWKRTGFEYLLLTLYPLNDNFSSNLGLHRRQGKPDFTARERTIVQTVFSQVEWLHQYGVNEDAREVTLALPPRERQTLIYLLSGCTHKSIATRMNISQHTVNDYVKQIHKRFNVNSRAELQAYFFLGGAAQA